MLSTRLLSLTTRGVVHSTRKLKKKRSLHFFGKWSQRLPVVFRVGSNKVPGRCWSSRKIYLQTGCSMNGSSCNCFSIFLRFLYYVKIFSVKSGNCFWGASVAIKIFQLPSSYFLYVCNFQDLFRNLVCSSQMKNIG